MDQPDLVIKVTKEHNQGVWRKIFTQTTTETVSGVTMVTILRIDSPLFSSKCQFCKLADTCQKYGHSCGTSKCDIEQLEFQTNGPYIQQSPYPQLRAGDNKKANKQQQGINHQSQPNNLNQGDKDQQQAIKYQQLPNNQQQDKNQKKNKKQPFVVFAQQYIDLTYTDEECNQLLELAEKLFANEENQVKEKPV